MNRLFGLPLGDNPLSTPLDDDNVGFLLDADDASTQGLERDVSRLMGDIDGYQVTVLDLNRMAARAGVSEAGLVQSLNVAGPTQPIDEEAAPLLPPSRVSFMTDLHDGLLSSLPESRSYQMQTPYSFASIKPSPMLGTSLPLQGTFQGSTGLFLSAADKVDHLVLPDTETWDYLPSRTTSILASSVQSWAHLPHAASWSHLKVETKEGKDHLYLYIQYIQPMIGWIMLTMGILIYSAAGPLMTLYPDGAQYHFYELNTIRFMMASVPFLILSIREYIRSCWLPEVYQHMKNPWVWLITLAGGINYGIHTGTFGQAVVLGDFMTSEALCSLHPFLIVMMRMCVGCFCHSFEKGGAAAAILSTVLMVGLSRYHGTQSMWITMEDFVSSISIAFYLLIQKQIRPLLPLNVILCANLWASALINALCAWKLETLVVTGPHPEWLLHPNIMYPTMFNSVSVMLAQFCFIACLKYLSAVVVSVGTAIEPAVGVIFVSIGDASQRPPLFAASALGIQVAAAITCAIGSSIQASQTQRVDVTDCIVANPVTPHDASYSPSRNDLSSYCPSKASLNLTPRDYNTRSKQW